jgi:AcrR family transcriptional regulator
MNVRSSNGGRRARAAEQLRASLIDAAETLLAERRPNAITSRDIAREAGVSDGVLYNHFQDKHDLLLTALTRRFARLVAAATADSAATGSRPVADGFADLVRRTHELHLAALPMIVNLVGDPPLLGRFMVEIHRAPLGGDALRRPIVESLVAEQALGRLGPIDLEAAADVILGAVLMQALIDVLGHRPAAESARHLDAIASTILLGLGPDPSPPARGEHD